MQETKPNRLTDAAIAGAVLGCLITGALGILVTFMGLLSGQLLVSAISLAASGFAFGLLANSLFRK